MNINEIILILNSYYPEVKIIDEEKRIILCRNNYKESTYQIFYFDCSGIWIDDEFDLQEHIEKILMNEYYSNAGYIQWNYYMVFLHDINNLDSFLLDKKAKIEKDEKYSRKFVIHTNSLNNWLGSKYKVQIDEISEIPQDLSLLWTKTLNDNNLECIYMKDITYTKGIDSILSGKPIKELNERENENNNGAAPLQRIPHIKKIVLDSYRQYPVLREFEFGKMNLLVGKNGCGKTSLLEAIELFLCGRNYRNPEHNDSSVNIKALFENESEYRELSLNSTQTFKLRDEFWYNNPPSNRNNLYKGFNRYNFFNTDASFEFTNEKEEGNISKALEDIALGESVNYIEKQLLGYKDRLEREWSSYEKDLLQYSEVITNERNTIKELIKEDISPELLFNRFTEEVRGSGWLGIIPLNINDDSSVFLIDFINMKINISKIISNCMWLNDATFNKINNEYKKLDHIIQDCDTKNQDILDLINESSKLKRDFDRTTKIKNLLQEVRPYFDMEIYKILIGLDNKINELNLKEIRFQQANRLLKKVDFQFFENSELFIDQYYQNIETQISSIEIKKDDLENAITKLKSGLTQLENIISEIKAKGSKYLETVKDASNCPLCNASYGEGELKKKIENAFINIQRSKVLEDMIKEQNNIKRSLQKLYTRKVNLENVMNVFIKIIYSGNDLKSMNLGFIINCLKQIGLDHIRLKGEYERLTNIKEELNSKGLYENKFDSIINELGILGINIESSINKSIVANKIEYNYLYNKLEKTKKLAIEKSEYIVLIIKDYLKDQNINPSISILRERFENITSSLLLYIDIIKIFDIPKNMPFRQKELELSKLHELFTLFEKDKTYKDKINNLMKNSIKIIEEYVDKEKQCSIIKQRIKDALKVVNSINKNQSKDKYLEDFLQENKMRIVQIFNEIHSPQEFDNIDFDKEGITLRRINSNSAKLSTISTGQRTALAISVFMCLNQKLKNGPSYLLFDDPISFIDDLNVLSFIDYLREYVINTDRQVFFATANENLAFLIEQKFRMLGDNDFKVHTFER